VKKLLRQLRTSKLSGAIVRSVGKLASITFLSLAFSYWIDYLGFITQKKLAAVLITPSLRVPNWSVIYIINTAPSVRKFYCIGLVSDFFTGKLLLKWEGPFVIEEVYRLGAVKIASLEGNTTQVVNGQRLKYYISGDSYNEDVDVIHMITPK
jgi:hypothetical protein